MMTPQLTEQYGQVLRVSVAREIFRLWVWAYTGARSNPKADRPTPLTRLPLRKVLRESSISRPPQFVREKSLQPFKRLSGDASDVFAQRALRKNTPAI